MLNRSQGIVLLTAAGLVGIALLFPPYRDDSGLIGGLVYAYFRHPPQGAQISFSGGMLALELGAVAQAAMTGLLMLRNEAARYEKNVGRASLAIQLCILAYFLPHLSEILAPEAMCYASLLVSVATLGSTLSWSLALRWHACR